MLERIDWVEAVFIDKMNEKFKVIGNFQLFLEKRMHFLTNW
jgi:hypothetical protein